MPRHPLGAEGLKGRPEADNLVGIYAALAGVPWMMCCGSLVAGSSRGSKSALAELALAKLRR